MCPNLRLAVAERPDQRNVLGRVAQMVLAADDVGDRHGLVVDHHHEVVERHPVAAHDHEVAEQRVVELDLAADQVVEADLLRRDLEAERRSASVGHERGAIRIGQAEAAPVVTRRLVTPLLLVPHRVELVRRAVAVVRGCAGQEPIGLARIQLHALTLAIRRVRTDILAAGRLWPLVPGDAEPVQVVDDVALEGVGAAGDVGVLDAQDVRAAHVPREEEVVEAGACRPDVQRPGGAGRHAHANGGCLGGAHRSPDASSSSSTAGRIAATHSAY